MTALGSTNHTIEGLPGLVERAASMLSSAKTAAEVLEAREFAGLAYDAAKRAARLTRAKAAHDDLIAAAHRAQAHALEIEAAAKRRMADEYDTAQAQGGVGQQGARTDLVRDANDVAATAADLGLNRREIHEARLLRDAEAADPGLVRRTLDERLEQDEEPTRMALCRMVVDAALWGLRSPRKPGRRNPLYVPPTPETSSLAASGWHVPRFRRVGHGRERGACARGPARGAGCAVS